MKFLRKLIMRDGQYGSISVPKPVLDAWASIEIVEMQFDENRNTLTITPKSAGDLQ
ncbi:MAG: hypothetical protein ACP5PV_09360 [Methanothrix sp.]